MPEANACTPPPLQTPGFVCPGRYGGEAQLIQYTAHETKSWPHDLTDMKQSPHQRTQLRHRGDSTVCGPPLKQFPKLYELGRRQGNRHSYCINRPSQHFEPRVQRGHLFWGQQWWPAGASLTEEPAMVGSQALRRPHAPFASHGTLRLDRDRIFKVYSGRKRLRRAPPVPRRYAVPRRQGDGGFTFRRRANLHVAGRRAAKRCDCRVMKRRVDVRMFESGRK